MTLASVTSHLGTKTSDTATEKDEFYNSIKEAHAHLGKWVRVARFLDQSTATVMRWNAKTHAPASWIKRNGVMTVVKKLDKLSEPDLELLKEKLSNNEIH